MRQDACVHSCETACMSVCTLVRRDVSACEWGGMLADTFVYFRHGPRTTSAMNPELLGQNMGPELLGRLGRLELRWRFSAAVSQSDVRARDGTRVLGVGMRVDLGSLMLQGRTKRCGRTDDTCSLWDPHDPRWWAQLSRVPQNNSLEPCSREPRRRLSWALASLVPCHSLTAILNTLASTGLLRLTELKEQALATTTTRLNRC